MQDIICKVDGKWAVLSWTDGLAHRRELTLIEEANKDPEAVINRLMRMGEWDMAEAVMDEYL